jgi:general secretion pathway protein G
MNKKAFTLVELLAVVVILAILGSIAAINVINSINDAKQTSYDTLVKSIESSTELYVADHSSEFSQLNTPGSEFTIQLNDLVEDKYIKANLVDDRTGDPIPLTTLIHINVGNNNKISVQFDYE